MTEGYVHSVEAGSFVDGPGIRFVVFLAGCPLRCRYCHNPDSWQRPDERTDATEVLGEIERAAAFLKTGCGGVTISGGEPLMQPEFALALLQGSKRLGLHTALDTSGFLGDRATDDLLEATDLVLLDIKAFDESTYRDVTGVELAPTLRFARRLSEAGKATWIRFVLVPGLTDDPAEIAALARFVRGLHSVERVEAIPFHQMGRHKWADLGIPYSLEDTPEPTPEQLARATAPFAAEGLEVDGARAGACTPATRRA